MSRPEEWLPPPPEAADGSAGAEGLAADALRVVERVARVADRVHAATVYIRRSTFIVPFVWLLALVALGLMPGLLGLLLFIFVLIVWGVCFALIGGVASNLETMVSGLGTIQSAIRSGVYQIDTIRALTSDLIARVPSGLTSPVGLHGAYRSIRLAVGTAADLRAISFIPYALGVGAVVALGVVGIVGLIALTVGVMT